MKKLGKLAILTAMAAVGLCVFEVGGRDVPVVASLVSQAKAIVGRPLTPVSVAGVARRTARRCVAGVYYC